MSKCINKLYSRLLFYNQISDLAFSNYLTEKLYLHALSLKKYNTKIYKLLNESIHKIPVELYKDVSLLLGHYDLWLIQFTNLESTKMFELNEPFVFHQLDNQSSYPKASITNILLYLENKIKNDKNNSN